MAAFFLIRKFFSHCFYSILRIFPNKELRKNRKFKDIHKGEECYILGSGPSISSHDLTKLSGKIVMTQNHFFAHKNIEQIKPSYHCIIPKYQPSEFDGDWKEWFMQMEDKLPQDTVYFMGLNTKYLIDNTKLKDKTYYLKTGLYPIFVRNTNANITKRIMNVPTVVTQCINIALYMGFEKIYLVGMDFSQHVLYKERDKLRFYGNSPITANEFEKKVEWDIHSSGKSYYNLWLTFIQFTLLKKYAKKKGQKIINLTAGGYIDTFERQNFEDIL